MKFKSGVVIKRLIPETIEILLRVEETAPVGYEPTVTSAYRKPVAKFSFHGVNKAFDFRTRDVPGFDLNNFEVSRFIIDKWISRMRYYLPSYKYDIVFGDKKHRDHIHIELDDE